MRPTRCFEYCPSNDHFSNNVASSDSNGRKTLHGKSRNTGICLLITACAAALIGACGEAREAASAPALLPLPATLAQGCGDGGYLQTTLYGAFEAQIDWATESLDCEGMPRLGGAGARLRFAGTAGDGDRAIAIIIALPALERGAATRELASNVTLIEEGSGRFFSTSGLDTCWTDVDEQVALQDLSDSYAISGTLYCITPLAEVNGDSSVSLRELRFAGLLDWSAK